MFEALTSFVHTYGLAGLFLASLLGSTIFIPFTVEITFPILVAAKVGKMQILFWATLGALCGTCINYEIGSKGIDHAKKYVKEKDILKAKKIMDKYGWIGLLTVMLLPLPLPVDPLTVLCGASKMDKKEFILAVAAGKAIKYAIILGLIKIITENIMT
jgi:membrane protein YqaA with SNARE-associated domain